MMSSCCILNVIFPPKPKYETLNIYSDWYTGLSDFNLPDCPSLDTLRISCFSFSDFHLGNAHNLRYIWLSDISNKTIDLSECPNLNYIEIYNSSKDHTKKTDLILAPQVYVRYIYNDPTLTLKLSEQINVVEAEP